MNRQEIGEMLDKERSLKRQVGGDHYRRFKIQPVEFIIANGIGFLAGNVIKYATRYAFKGGAADIRKIIHYCELILEFEYGEGPASNQEQAKVRSTIEVGKHDDWADQKGSYAQGPRQGTQCADNAVRYKDGSLQRAAGSQTGKFRPHGETSL
jgi:Protein of unknwon function (DUF3310)